MDSSSGGDEESATNEETADGTKEVAVQEDATNDQSKSSSSGGETGASDGTRRISGGVETNEDEYGGIENIEIDAEPAGAAEILEEVAVGEGDQVGPIFVTGASGQQAIQPTLPVESTVPVPPIVPIEPAVLAQPIAFEDSIVLEEPVFYFENPAYFYDYSAYYYEDPAYYDYSVFYYENPAYYEEQTMAEPGTLDASDTPAFETVSEEEDGGSGAYAAMNSG